MKCNLGKKSFHLSLIFRPYVRNFRLIFLIANVFDMHALSDNGSVNPSSAHPPPRVTAGHLLTLSFSGVGHLQFYRGPEAFA